MHARPQVMNANLSAVDINLDAVRHIGNVPNASILHFDYQVVAFHEHNLPVLDSDLLFGIAGLGDRLCLYLGTGNVCENKTDHCCHQHESYLHPLAYRHHFSSSVIEIIEDCLDTTFPLALRSVSVSASSLLCQELGRPDLVRLLESVIEA